MSSFNTDIAIIGGGGAGLRAAIAAAEENPELSVLLISKVYPVRSHTVSAEGGIAGVMSEDDSHEKHCFDTIRGSDYLADQDAVEFFVNEAPKEIIQLEHWGCPWSREENGDVAVRAFGGMSTKRTVYAADKTGFYMLHSLFERSLKYPNIKRLDEYFVTKLVTDFDSTGGETNNEKRAEAMPSEKHTEAENISAKTPRVIGCIAMNLQTGELVSISAKTTILATGGAGKVYSFTTNALIKTGDGMALAYKAGAELKDMEFVQFHPTGLPRTGILITEGARGEGGYLLNNLGERFMERYLPNKMELGPRDIISRSIMSEIKAGRGFSGPYGEYVHLDIRHLGEEKINEKLPLVREMSLDFAGVDPINEPIPVMPVVHYSMGGVATNVNAKSSLKGLFAAGETACVSINGANRLGSNSLAECLVFGARAGLECAKECKSSKLIHVSARELADEENRIAELLQRTGSKTVATVKTKLQEIMQKHAGIERDHEGLVIGLNQILSLKRELKNIELGDKAKLFNTELTGYLELENMFVIAEAILRSALDRKESRGSHTRSDFTERNDEEFLHHTHVLQDQKATMSLSRKPVTITKWKPQPRVY